MTVAISGKIPKRAAETAGVPDSEEQLFFRRNKTGTEKKKRERIRNSS